MILQNSRNGIRVRAFYGVVADAMVDEMGLICVRRHPGGMCDATAAIFVCKLRCGTYPIPAKMSYRLAVVEIAHHFDTITESLPEASPPCWRGRSVSRPSRGCARRSFTEEVAAPGFHHLTSRGHPPQT